MRKHAAIVQPLALAFLLAVGFATAFALLVAWGLLVIDHVIQPRPITRYVVVQSNGTPIIREYSSLSNRYSTLDGKEIPERQVEWTIPGATLVAKNLSRFIGTLSWQQRLRLVGAVGRPATLWYFVHDGNEEGHAYLVGFDSQSKYCVGYVGRAGFRPDEPPLEDRFPVSRRLVGQYAEFASLYGSRYLLNGSYFNRGTDDDPPLQLLSGDRVETINLRAHSVRTLFASPGLISAGVERPATPKPLDKMALAEMPKPSLVARTEDRLLLVSMSGAPLGSYIIPSEFRRETFTFYELVGGEGLALVSRYGLRRQASDLYWFDREGRITRQAQVTNSTSTSIFVYPGLGGWVRAAICPVPIVAAISVPGPEAGEYFDSGEAASMPQAIARALADTWPVLVVVLALSGVLAWLVVRRQRKYAQPYTVPWAIFVFVFGLPGMVAYLVHRRWPTCAPCPACHKTVPRDRESCAACGTEFPPPAPKGIELMEASA